MDEDKDEKETPSRGNEWEVVSLTASTYAAAPGPESSELNDDNHGNMLDTNDEETSRAMFMSGHFVFPPSQHENLPLDYDDNEIHNKSGGELGDATENSGLDVEEGDRYGKNNEESWNLKGMREADELHGIQFFDENGKRLSVRASEFEEGRSLLGLDVAGKEQSIYSAGNFSSIHNEADISGSNLTDENLTIPESSDPLISNSDPPLDSTSPIKENKFNESGLPCEAWWRKRAASLFAQAKDANAFWSVFVAAALMGLVILGQRWQSQQVKLQSVISDEKMNRILGNRMLAPLSRFKDVFVSSHRTGSVIKGSLSTER